jgi:hypothetical protein
MMPSSNQPHESTVFRRIRRSGGGWAAWLAAAALLRSGPAAAQIDPHLRRVVQTGYTLPLHEYGPIAAYAFYYHNRPDFPRTNQTLRLALSPVYVDGELGFRELIGPQTDFAVGLAGGGFADSYAELRRGNFFTGESFVGHGFEGSASVYHRFNPERRLPVFGILRASMHQAFYAKNDDTASTFHVPDDQPDFRLRVGVQAGGRAPSLVPRLAGELKVVYDYEHRFNAGPYGFNGDRWLNADTHRYWGRALLAYTFPQTEHQFEVSLTAGGSVNADRFSMYQLGGSLPFISEVPLYLPGYHLDEISADRFALFAGSYVLPLWRESCWALTAYGAAGWVDYHSGFEQAGNFHSGAGGGILYRSRSRAWLLGVTYGYGFQAIRAEGGGQSVTFVLQYDVDADVKFHRAPFWKWKPKMFPKIWNGLLGR